MIVDSNCVGRTCEDNINVIRKSELTLLTIKTVPAMFCYSVALIANTDCIIIAYFIQT